MAFPRIEIYPRAHQPLSGDEDLVVSQGGVLRKTSTDSIAALAGGSGGVSALSGCVRAPIGSGTFTAGTPVGINSSTGSVVACDASISATFPCIGIWTADGYIRANGVEAIAGFAAGALLYVAVGGGLTVTEPVNSGQTSQPVAKVLAGGVSMFVFGGGLQVSH